jgi:O-antigen/teichoic acid export membrane protein
MLVARLMGKEVFGELGILLSTFTLLEKLSLFGLGVMATRYVARYREADPARTGRVLGLSIVVAAATGGALALLVCLGAPWIADTVLDRPDLAAMLMVGSGLILLYSVIGVLEGALAGFEAFKSLALVNFIGGIVALPAFVYATWVGGLLGVVSVMVAVGLFQLGIDFACLQRIARVRGCGVRMKGIFGEVEVLRDFSLPVFLSTQTLFGAEWLGSWLLIRGQGGFVEMGVFSAATRLQQFVSFVPLYVGRALFPALSERHGAGDRAASTRMLKYYILITTGLAGVCALGISLLSPFIMSGYGAAFREGWPVLVVVSLTVVLMPFRWAIEMVYRSAGKVWYELLLNVAWLFVLVAGMLTLGMRGSLRLSVSILAAFFLTNLAGGLHVYVRFLRAGTDGGEREDA